MSQTAKLPGRTARTTVIQTMVSWVAQGPASCLYSLPHRAPGLSSPPLPLQMRALRGKLQRVLKALSLWRKAPEQ